jgi:hypothetical protein
MMHAVRMLIPSAVVVIALGSVLISCGNDTTGPARSPAQTYWALQLNPHAVSLALTAGYDTVQLTATPMSPEGIPLSGLGTVTYTATDSNVTVSPTGLVTAHYTTAQTSVIAQLQAQGVTLKDTVFIKVTDTPPTSPLDVFSIQPAPGDSAKRALDFNNSRVTWTAKCDGTDCSGPVYYHSSNPIIASINRQTGTVILNDTGHVVFTATTMAYNVARQDSLTFTVGYQLSPEVDITLAMILGVLTLGFVSPKKLILGVGAVVTFCNHSPKPVDVVFDRTAGIDTATCTVTGQSIGTPTGSGNISAFGGVFTVDTTMDPSGGIAVDTMYFSQNASEFSKYLPNCASRRFTQPGIYHFHSTLFPSETVTVEIRKD